MRTPRLAVNTREPMCELFAEWYQNSGALRPEADRRASYGRYWQSPGKRTSDWSMDIRFVRGAFLT